jgi:hypothetical protein
MNFTLSSKITQVENQLLNVSNYSQQIMSSVNGQEQHIRSVMDDIQKQQSWISEITMDMNSKGSQNDEMNALFNWQIKEQTTNSKVIFHYAIGNQNAFTSIPVENEPNGVYQAEVPLSLHMEPQWEFFLREEEPNSDTSKWDEKRKEEATQQSMRYFVSITHGDAVKSSEIITAFLGDVGIETYGVISVNLDIENDKSSVIVTTYKTGLLENIKLLKYENEILIHEQKLKPEFDHYILENINLKSANKFILQVTYKNGETFEKVIYER